LIILLGFNPGCSGGSSSSLMNPPPGGSADVVITINGNNGGMSFSPASANVQVGQTVAWHNADSMAHTATQNGSGFNTGTIPAGTTSAPMAMNSTGALGYHCSIHPSMTGTLNVTP
jgi:plastocyanin